MKRVKGWHVWALLLCVAAALGLQDIPGEFLQRPRTWVTDFGAVPNDGKDDSAAIKACIVAAMANGLYHVHFPAGTFDIDSNNVLHPVTAGTVSAFGIKFTGDAQNYSILKLKRSAGNTRWLYDSDEVPGWNRVQFEHLYFQTDMPSATSFPNYDATHAAEVNGFRIWGSTPSGAVDKGFVFGRCRFDGFGTPLQFTGTAVTDGCHGYSNWMQNCGPIVFENDQCLGFKWYACRFWHTRDLLWIKNTTGEGAQGKGGAGDILLDGADIVHDSVGADTTAYYTLRVDDGAAFARNLTFRDSRWELKETTYSRVVHKRGSSSFTFTNEILFDGCDLSVNQGADSSREYLTLGGITFVHFRDCHINERWAIRFYDVDASAVVGLQYQPLVVFDDCALGPTFVSDLANRITYDSGSTNTDSYGRVISRGGRALTSTNLNDNYAFDFDYGASRAGRGEPAKERRWIPLKAAHQAWPTSSGGVGASERTVTLAPNQKIWAVSIDRPASGSGATLTQYRVGSNDKSITYCATGPIRADGHHKAYADATTDPGLFPISVGTDANLRQVRLWLGPVEHTLTTTGGEAMILVE